MSVYGLRNNEDSFLQLRLELLPHPEKEATLRLHYQGAPITHAQLAGALDRLFHLCIRVATFKGYTIDVQAQESLHIPVAAFFIDLDCLSKHERDLVLQQKKLYEQELAAAIEIASLAHHSSCDVIDDAAWPSLKELLIRIASRLSHFSTSELLEEALRAFLATDSEFKKIRPIRSLARLSLSHVVLRKSMSALFHKNGSDKVKTRLWRSTLIFPFGKQKTTSLAISLSALSSYEQFELQHILHACRRIVPSLKSVPNSYYFYKHPRDQSWNFYVELEKEGNGTLLPKELFLLKKKLSYELSSSIEKVMNTIEIPHNEEDILRSIRVLSHELTAKNPIPQVLIQFQKQKSTSVVFDLYLMKLVKEQDLFPLKETEKYISHKSVSMRLQRQEIIGKTRNKHVKLLHIYEVTCDKKNLIQPDYSINFILAREQVVDTIQAHIGQIRDVNGGFLAEQKNLLLTLKYAMSLSLKEQEEALLEHFIRNLSPNVSKSRTEQSTLVSLANLLLQLYKDPEAHARESLIFRESNDCLCIVMIKQATMTAESLLQPSTLFLLKETEMLHSFLIHEGISYACFAFLSKDMKVRNQILDWYQNLAQSSSLQLKKYRGIHISLPRPIRLLDPRIGTDRTSSIVIKMLYEGLLSHNAQGELVLAAAKAYSVSEDGLTYLFSLRESYWSNGQRVTAHDFEHAWKKMLDPSVNTLYYHLFLPIKNAKSMKEGAKSPQEVGIKALDDETLLVELERPYPYFKELLAHWIYSPLCSSMDITQPGWAFFGAESHASNGPFRLSQWRRKNEIEAVKNEWYWNKQEVLPERIHLKVIEDPSLAWTMFLKGELDWIGEPLSPIPFSVIRSSHPEIKQHQTNAVQMMSFNTTKKLFSHKKARLAFSLGLDRQHLIKTCRFGHEKTCHSLIASQWSVLDQKPLAYSPEEAKQLFQEVLDELGMSSSHVSLKMRVYDTEFLVMIARHVASEWEKLFHISIELEILEWYQFYDEFSDLSYDIVVTLWYSWMNYALYTFEAFLSKSNTTNFSKWEHKEFQETVHALMHTKDSDNEKRKTLSERAEKLLLEEMPVVPVFEYQSQYAHKSSLKGVVISPLGTMDFRWAHLC